MKNSKLLFLIFYMSFCTLLGLPPINGYWGKGDCTKAHPLQYVNVPTDPEAELQLDGVVSENFWRSDHNKAGNVVIPLASNINQSNFFIVYLNATFIFSKEYLLILFEWEDNTTMPIGGDINDGIFICWNINVVNFSAYYINGMETSNMGGGNVDCWSLNLNQDSPPNGSSYYCQDLCFGDNGWYNPNLEFEDVSVAYTYVENQSYTVEMMRKISTADKVYDVQFNQKIVYKFNLAIMDNGDHEDHALSWTYAFDLRSNVVIQGYLPNLIIVISVIPIAFIIKKLNLKKLKIRNVA
jgi:hypothetical protein